MQQIIIKEFTNDILGNRETVRANTSRGEEIVKIPLPKLVVREGFNVRQDMGDIAGLAQSILNNGQEIAGRVDVLKDGTFAIVDGHRRYQACLLLEGEGHEVFFKAIVNGNKTTEQDRIFQMFTTQDNKAVRTQTE